MRTKKIFEKGKTDGDVREVVWAIIFRPDGKQMVASVGHRLFIIDPSSTDPRFTPQIGKGHHGIVFALSYSADGKRFASGGADKTVIIWTAAGEPFLRYTHNYAIQALAYNPVTQQLASGTDSDLGLWSPDQKQVHKEKVNSRILCMSWTNDGQFLACGQYNGQISIRDRQGQEKYVIRRTEPVWCLAWNPAKEEAATLAVGCWDQTLSFYQLNGKQVGGDRKLDYDPCSLSYFSNGEYLVMGGSNCQAILYTRDGVTFFICVCVWAILYTRDGVTFFICVCVWAILYTRDGVTFFIRAILYTRDGVTFFIRVWAILYTRDGVTFFIRVWAILYTRDGVTFFIRVWAILYTRDGVKLTTVAERKGWVWACQARPKHNFVAIGANDCTMSLYQLIFNTVHGLYQDRYAYRDVMTDVVVQSLTNTDQRLRIRLHEYVQKIAVFRDRLAVQMPERLAVYELAEDEQTGELKSLNRQTINEKFDCNLLVVTSNHIILCQDCKVTLLNFDGVKEREWVLDSVILYMKKNTNNLKTAESQTEAARRNPFWRADPTGTSFSAPTSPPFVIQSHVLVKWVAHPIAYADDVLTHPALPHDTTYVPPQVVGGPPGREGLLVGLLNGSVLNIYVDNPFPIQLLWHTAPVRCLDLSMSRSRLAVVDDSAHLHVYDVNTKERLMHETNVNGVAWNTEFEQMLCYSGNGMLSLKVADLPVYKQRMPGLVVGLKGSKVFCLRHVSMLTYDVPQSYALYRFIERQDFDAAYQIACLGVTDADWRMLGIHSLRELELTVAKKAFLRVRDTKYLDLLADIETLRKQPGYDERMAMAQVLAFQGRYQEAARTYAKAAHIDKAIELFSDLRDYEEALIFAQSTSDPAVVKDLILRQARWCEEVGNVKAAAKIYLQAGMPMKAVTMQGDRGWVDELAQVMRSLPKSERQALALCGEYFLKHKANQYARETFLKIGDTESHDTFNSVDCWVCVPLDTESLVALHVRLGEWEQAIQAAEGSPALAATVYLPYASWLAEHGRFEEAHEAFQKANRPDQSLSMLEELGNNAVGMSQFAQAARYIWLLALQTLESSKPDAVKRFEALCRKAELYYAYRFIYQVTCNVAQSSACIHLPHALTSPRLPVFFFLLHQLDPFTSHEADTIFNIARFVYANAQQQCPERLSLAYTLYALSKHARTLGAFKFARQVCASLQTMRLPAHWGEQVDLAALTVRAKPFTDREDLQTMCWRCGSNNPLSLAPEDQCQHCQAPFVRSFYSFDSLPLLVRLFDSLPLSSGRTSRCGRDNPSSNLGAPKLFIYFQVEFHVAEGVTDEEACRLIALHPVAARSGGALGGDLAGWTDGEGAQTLSLDAAGGDGASTPRDPFMQQLTDIQHGDLHHVITLDRAIIHSPHTSASPICRPQHGDLHHVITLDRAGLRAQPPHSIFIQKWKGPLRYRYYRNLAPDTPLVLCPACWHFFLEEDFEFSAMQDGVCPFCKTALSKLGDAISQSFGASNPAPLLP
ncbi:putative Intraflagellar transport protein [Paratrimastix pyriformis]|uniref:Intraflagellar transport protein 122 homolog n=1 Tax=Paratrimastix pyriformis TaxID=342808 RepID=A0ABQ8UJX9_9EUKA|nr:putative Intraflagellar transport protein [Paratrimastix pyriformis]